MTLYYAEGSPTTEISDEQLRNCLFGVYEKLGKRREVLAVPPDFTRYPSRAGQITCLTHEYYGSSLVDVLPALGTHDPMPDWQLAKMFPGIPATLFREHRWRMDVVTLGEVPAQFVHEATEGHYDQPWTAQVNRLLYEGGHDLIISMGQVVPHEVVGMANYNKNVFIGTGGAEGIGPSHYLSAVYGMERIMGRADTPLRRILNRAQELFLQDLPLLFVQTVVGTTSTGETKLRGIFIGDDAECFELASKLAVEVNFEILDQAPQRIVVYLDEEEFHSTWLGNKSIYRTRMAIADGGELIVLAPGVRTFGEDSEIDRLLRKYGYRTTAEVKEFVDENEDLRGNLAAAAHIIHSSSDGRFQVTYCPGGLTREETEGVGFSYGELSSYLETYPVDELTDGWHTGPDGTRFFYISNPALGLWAHRERLPSLS